MKVYDRAKLTDWWFNLDLTKEKPMCETDKDIEFGDIVKYNGDFYCICGASALDKPSYLIVELIEDFNPSKIAETEVSEIFCEDEVKCPYCGYEYEDSWEFAEEEENYECANCKSIFDFQRVISVTYSSQPVKLNKDFKEI